jgi:hypothetical protein
MNNVFVVCNQLGQFWGKKKKWVDGTDPKRVLTCKHEDEAVNQLVELSARDIDLRGAVQKTEATERGIPKVEPSKHLIADEPDPIIAAETEASDARAEESGGGTGTRNSAGNESIPGTGDRHLLS